MVAILIPAYGHAEQLDTCLQSLASHAPTDCLIFVLDDGTPDNFVEACCERQNLPNLTYVRSDVNQGFVKTCNWGWSQIAPTGSDILLLNSDTEVTACFLEEMLRVLYLFERHGVVTPRSNNATIYSVPLDTPDMPPEESYSIWKTILPDLPEYGIMPTAVGFCMLIKALVLERFGLFDEIYNPGYNEENDFICRINRYGYSSVVANRAFVFHQEGSTFGSKRGLLQSKHHQILLTRYPEYETKTLHYIESELDPVEKFAILRRKHRPAILYDLFHLPAKHTGSSEFALSLLREVYTQTHDEWDLFVGISEEARYFAADLYGYRLFEDRPENSRLFDVAFKPAQIFTWAEFRRMNHLSPRISFVLQDIIAVRSDNLAYPARKTIFVKTVEMADQLFTISRFSHADFEAYFGLDFPSITIHHGTNIGITPGESQPDEHVLLIGNNFLHKGVKEAAACLSGVGPVRVLGGDKPSEALPENIQWLKSGQITPSVVRELYAKASVVVYPSHYEGFGLPIIEGIALGKPVVALDTELNRELAASIRSGSLTLVRTLPELKTVVASLLLPRHSIPPPQDTRRWSDAAKEYVTALRTLLNAPQNAAKMRARQSLVRVLDSASHL